MVWCMNIIKIKSELISQGMKEKDCDFLIKLAKRKKISIGRAFFIYSWKYYAWSSALLLAVVFASLHEGIVFFVENMIFCLAVALISLVFTPFFKVLLWSIKIQVFLIGK